MLLQDNELRLKVIHTIDREKLLENAHSVLCCLSGGVDSTVLLHVLSTLSEKYGFLLSAVHVNHCIRGNEADRDELFCRSLCEKLGVPLYVEHEDVPKYAQKNGMSTELAARELRYAAFDRVMDSIGADCAATAHNANDNAETLLFNIIRGTSASGICAIPYKRGRYIRPLLNVTRSEICEYSKAFDIEYVTDSTNNDDIYTRNFIRHNIIPLCEKLNPSFVEAATRLSDSAKADEELIIAGGCDLTRKARIFLEENGVRGINNDMLKKISAAAENGGSKRFALKGGRVLLVENGSFVMSSDDNIRYDYEKAVLKKGRNEFFDGAVSIDIEPSAENFREIYKTFTTVGHVSDIIFSNVCVRNRLPGDAITVNGIHRSVKKELINKKVPLRLRKALPIICIDGKIAFVPYVGVDDAFSPKSGSGLKISVSFNFI